MSGGLLRWVLLEEIHYENFSESGGIRTRDSKTVMKNVSSAGGTRTWDTSILQFDVLTTALGHPYLK